jgi:hypothetical protein
MRILGVAYAMHLVIEQALSKLWKGLFTAGLHPLVSAQQGVFARLGLRPRSAG